MLSQVLKIVSRVLDLIKQLFGQTSQIISQETEAIPQIAVKERDRAPQVDVKETGRALQVDVKESRDIPEIDFKAQIDQNWSAAQSTLPSRTVVLRGPITPETADDLIGHLLFLERLSNDPIMLVISSEGGQAYAGLAIYDALRHLSVPLITVADTTCGGNGLLLLLAGQKRYALSDTLIAYTVLSGRMKGQPSDYVIQSMEIQRLQAIHDAIFQQYKQSGLDLTTDHHLSPEEAMQYKWIDAVVDRLEDIGRH